MITIDSYIYIISEIAVILTTILFIGIYLSESQLWDCKGRLLPIPKPFINFRKVRPTRQVAKTIHEAILRSKCWNLIGLHVRWSNVKVVFLTHPEYAKIILTGHYSKFPKSLKYHRLYFFLGTDGLVTSGGHKWQQHRHLINPGFHADTLKGMTSSFSENTLKYVEELKTKISSVDNNDSLRLNLNKEVSGLTMKIICQAAFGFSIHEKTIKSGEDLFLHMSCIEDELVNRMNDPTDWWHRLFPSRYIRADKAVAVIDEILLDVIEERKKARRLLLESLSSKKEIVQTFIEEKEEFKDLSDNKDNHLSVSHPKDLVDILLDAAELGEKEGGGEKGLTMKQIRDHTMTFFLAGHDTTSSLISWTFYELCLHPTIMTSCQKEIDEIFEKMNLIDAIPYEAIGQFEYILAVLKENLRLHPPAVGLGRKAVDDVELKGVDDEYSHGSYFIPKGTIYGILLHSLHRHPDFWTNPEDFDPTRFLKENIKQTLKHPFQYLPFSGGARNCIGQRYAIMEATVIVALLLRNFNLSMSEEDKKKVRLEEVIVQHPRDLFITLTKRETKSRG